MDDPIGPRLQQARRRLRQLVVLASALIFIGLLAFLHYQKLRIAEAVALIVKDNIAELDLRGAKYDLTRFTDQFTLIRVLDPSRVEMLRIPVSTFGTAKEIDVSPRITIDLPAEWRIEFRYGVDLIGLAVLVVAGLVLIGLYLGEQALARRMSVAYAMQAEVTYARATGQLARQIAHDLKSPMGALKALAHTMYETDDSARELFNSVVSRVSAILNDLSALSRGGGHHQSTRGVLALKDMGAVVNGVAMEKRIEFGTSRSLEVRVPSEIQGERGYVSISRFGLERIVSNLLNNAVEATGESGKISLDLTVDPREVRILIRDDGIGISERDLNVIRHEARSIGKPLGQGLGLASAREWILAAGGKLEIESSQGKGTQVILVLPVIMQAGAEV